MLRDVFLPFILKVWHTASLDHVGRHSFHIGGMVVHLLAGVPPEVVAATGGWTSLAFLIYWCRLEEIIPLSTSKAYTALLQTSSLTGIFEQFHVRQNISASLDSSASHLSHPVPT